MHPFIDRETQSTPSSSSELLILGCLIDLRLVTYFPRVLEKCCFSESEFVSNSTDPRIRVGVETFSVVSELSSSRALFPLRSAISQTSAGWRMVFDLGELGVTRWLEKLPDPSAVQDQEPKTRVVPSGTLLASLDPAIKFADELAESPTWCASCRCLPPSLVRDTLSSRVCR